MGVDGHDGVQRENPESQNPESQNPKILIPRLATIQEEIGHVCSLRPFIIPSLPYGNQPKPAMCVPYNGREPEGARGSVSELLDPGHSVTCGTRYLFRIYSSHGLTTSEIAHARIFRCVSYIVIFTTTPEVNNWSISTWDNASIVFRRRSEIRTLYVHVHTCCMLMDSLAFLASAWGYNSLTGARAKQVIGQTFGTAAFLTFPERWGSITPGLPILLPPNQASFFARSASNALHHPLRW